MTNEQESSSAPTPPAPRNTTIDTKVQVTTAESGSTVVGMAVQNLTITEEQAYNVGGLTNPYLGLRSFGYDDRAKYAGRERTIAAGLKLLTAPRQERAL